MNKNLKIDFIVLCSLLVIAVFSPVASALPVFSRQTGYECSQCHFQSFPMLNAFGRSFKNSGFTMIGNEGKVEAENKSGSPGMSLPAQLNLGVLTTMGIETVSNEKSTTNPNKVYDTVNTPAGGGELSLFYGGRISANMGFLAELGAAGSAESSSAKLPIFYEVADGTNAGVVFMTTDGQGAAHSFETLNTGAVAVQRMVPNPGVNSNDAHIKVNSAAQYLGTATGAQGVSFVVNNSHYFVNVGKYAVITKLGSSTKSGAMRMSYARAAGIFDVAGFDSAVGVQVFRGDDGGTPDSLGNPTLAINPTEATIIDAQLQGQVGNYPLGIYLSYGSAPAKTDPTGGVNLFNSGNVETATSLNLAAQFGMIPGKATLMAAMRMAKNGAVDVSKTAVTDNALMVGASYKLVENVEASLEYTTQSGTAWDAVSGAEPAGKTVTTLMLQAMF
jgi:hypothetical protein